MRVLYKKCREYKLLQNTTMIYLKMVLSKSDEPMKKIESKFNNCLYLSLNHILVKA